MNPNVRLGIVALLLKALAMFLYGVGVISVIVAIVVLANSSWRPHLFGLLAKSWSASLGATSATTLSVVLSLVITPVLVFVGVNVHRLRSWDSLLDHLSDSLWAALVGFAVPLGLVAIVFGWSVARTIYNEHQTQVSASNTLQTTNAQLTADLTWRKHNISTTDAVFPNIIYLLQAFQIFRNAQGGRPCVIWFTATPDSMALASTVAQFSNSVSGCSTFGPMPPGNPDLDADVMNGMVPGVIVLHAPRENAAANQIEVHLGNQIQVRRSYAEPLIPKPRLYVSMHGYAEDFIWLQFGTNVQWNSELFAAQRRR